MDWATTLALCLFGGWLLMVLAIMRWFRVTVGRPGPPAPTNTDRRPHLRRRRFTL